MYSTNTGPWKPYHGEEIALDVKVTGADCILGLKGLTMKDYLSHARTVIQAARRNTLELVAAAQLLFLLRRPPGPTFDGKHHAGAYSCVAVGVDVLLGLHPTKARQAPSTIALTGLLLQRAAAEEAASLPPPRPWGRWADLQQLEVRSGYVIAQDFCALLKIGAGNPKKGVEQVLKRLRKDSCTDHILDWRRPGDAAGRPWKIARISDLRRSYSGLG